VDLKVTPCRSLDEFRRALVIWRYFGGEATDEDAEKFSRWLPLERLHAARDGDEVAGGAGAFPFELSVPGGRVRAGGVTVVGVQPSYRRRGVLRALMRAQLDDIHARGEPVAYLWASEAAIYGRFGYGLASLQLDVKVPRDRSGFAAPVEPYGRVRFVDRDEALARFPEIYEAVMDERPGMFGRSEVWWQERALPEKPRQGGPQHQRVLLELDGRAEGYAVYSVHQSFEEGSSSGHVWVVEAMGRTPEATRAIWRFLLDLDWTTSIRADKLPVDHPLVLLLAEPRRAGARVGDALWVRLVDVGAALSARSFAGDGEVVLEVRDAFCPWNEGRWRVSTAGAERTEAQAEIALDVAELGSVYLGGFTFRQLADALRVEERSPGAIARADAIFRTVRAPWCPEIF
jgi:predicted acetyltransferase